MKKTEKLGFKVLKKYDREIKNTPASRIHHLNIKGGLKTHLLNVHKIAKKYFPKEHNLHFLALVHDIGKARVYYWQKTHYLRKGDSLKLKKGMIKYTEPSVDHIIHTIEMLHEFGIVLTLEELNALQLHHGGWSRFKGEMTPLAVKLHFCDLLATVIESNTNQKR